MVHCQWTQWLEMMGCYLFPHYICYWPFPLQLIQTTHSVKGHRSKHQKCQVLVPAQPPPGSVVQIRIMSLVVRFLTLAPDQETRDSHQSGQTDIQTDRQTDRHTHTHTHTHTHCTRQHSHPQTQIGLSKSLHLSHSLPPQRGNVRTIFAHL